MITKYKQNFPGQQ